MNEHIAGELSAYCYIVKTGCKPVATIPIQDRYCEQATEIIKNQQLNYYSESLSEGWMTIYIYKHDYMLEIIKNSPNNPKTPYEHWILGKMFGYSEEEIGKFIT